MASIGTVSVNVVPSMSGFTSRVSRGLSGLSGLGQTAGSQFSTGFAAKAGAVSGLVQTAVSAATGAISSSLGAAISRVDQLNNFPRVMENLGYSADSAQASIDRMSEAIDGLPTSLDSISGMTQQLAPLAGSLENATDISIAFNNALLAGGASGDEVGRAMQQYTQILAKGKPELEDWRTLQEIMPGQLNQLAQALVGPTANSMDLYNAMQDGSVSIDDFNQALVDLNESGINGFASFEQQARDSTQGIGTALENVQTRISKAVGSIINAIGAEEIAGVINGFSSQFAVIADVAVGAIETIKANWPTLQPIFTSIAAGIGAVVAAMTAMSAVNTISGLVSSLSAIASPIGLVVAGIAAAAAGFAYLYQTSEPFRASVDSMLGTLSELASQLMDALGPVVQEVGEQLMNLGSTIMPIMQQAAQAMMPAITSIIQGIVGVATALAPLVQTLVSVLGPILTQIISVVMQVVGTIQPIVMGFFGVLIQLLTPVINLLVGILTPAIQAIGNVVMSVMTVIQNIVSTVLSVVQGLITAAMQAISGDWSGAWETVKSTLSGAWEAIKSGVSGGIDAVVNFFANLPSNILGALGDLGGLLVNAGESIIGGLLDGLKAAWDGVVGWFGNITASIAELKGPPVKDAKLLVGNGELIMGGLLEGMQAGWGSVETYLSSRTAAVQGSISSEYGVDASYQAEGRSSEQLLAEAVALLDEIYRVIPNTEQFGRMARGAVAYEL